MKIARAISEGLIARMAISMSPRGILMRRRFGSVWARAAVPPPSRSALLWAISRLLHPWRS